MPVLPLSRRRALVPAVLLIGALVLAGRYLGEGGAAETAPRARPPAALKASKPVRFVVHVVGAVRRPGLYALADGSRIADAVSRAGGATRRADLAQINLAAPVVDGAQIVVPRREAPAGGVAAAPGTGAASNGPVHLNTATLEQLEALPGVGPVTAQKILEFREAHGGFRSVDELDAVPGIGPARLEELRAAVTP